MHLRISNNFFNKVHLSAENDRGGERPEYHKWSCDEYKILV